MTRIIPITDPDYGPKWSGLRIRIYNHDKFVHVGLKSRVPHFALKIENQKCTPLCSSTWSPDYRDSFICFWVPCSKVKKMKFFKYSRVICQNASLKTELTCEIRFQKYWKLIELVAKNRDFWTISNIFPFLEVFFFQFPQFSIFFINGFHRWVQFSKTRLLTYHTTIFEKFHFLTLLQGLLNFEADVRTVPDYSEKK